MAADIDRALEAARNHIAARDGVYARFTATGRELALAEQELADARASADNPARSSRWRRRRGGDEPITGPDVAALRARVEQLRAERPGFDGGYGAAGDPTAAYAELLERKCALLAAEAGPAGDEVRRLDNTLGALEAGLADLEVAIGDGEAAEACARDLRDELVEAVQE